MTPQDPPVFQLLAASADVTAIVGANPSAIFAAGSAPQGTLPPYITWQIVAGGPENYLGDVPDMDALRVQVEFWGADRAAARTLYRVCVAALEGSAHQVSFNLDEQDAETRYWRHSADFRFWLPRT